MHSSDILSKIIESFVDLDFLLFLDCIELILLDLLVTDGKKVDPFASSEEDSVGKRVTWPL